MSVHAREAFFLPGPRPPGRFCLLHLPTGPVRGCVLFVPPFAEEMNKSRRMVALTAEHLDLLVGIAREMGFESIDYDQLSAWREGGELPARPIMFDFDHPVKSMRYEIHETLARHGYSGNLFVNTGWLDPEAEGYGEKTATWEELGELMELGWHIGAHTVTHPNLSELVGEDPEGEKLQWELVL